jgi:hypothetical protein
MQSDAGQIQGAQRGGRIARLSSDGPGRRALAADAPTIGLLPPIDRRYPYGTFTGGQMQADRTDAELIRQLEEKLLESSIRTSIGAVADLLADDFVEFGSSGRVFNKREIIASLQQEDGTCRRSLHDFEAKLLAPGVILATYRVLRQADNSEPAIQSLRSSIWKLTDGRWQTIFHQGTLTS